MGEYLPFIIAIGYFVYQFYANFQKAQDEAKKRNPSKPWEEVENAAPKKQLPKPDFWGQDERRYPVDPEPVTWRRPATVSPVKPGPVKTVEPEPFLIREVKDHPGSKEPKYVSAYEKPVYEKTVYEKPVFEKPFKSKFYQSKKSSIPTKVKVSDQIIHDGTSKNAYKFDIRDAIIKKAILDRPWT